MPKNGGLKLKIHGGLRQTPATSLERHVAQMCHTDRKIHVWQLGCAKPDTIASFPVHPVLNPQCCLAGVVHVCFNIENNLHVIHHQGLFYTFKRSQALSKC